jgi:hypothetical protein
MNNQNTGGAMKRFEELKQRLALAWRILRHRDGNLVRHTVDEFRAVGYFDGDEMDAMMAAGVTDLVRVFSTQGHSGFSASFAIGLFHDVANFKPLGPLTGADSEWFDHGPEMPVGRFQNRRAGHVFKDTPDGPAYDSAAVVFEEPSGGRFTGRHSRQFVTFPYAPRSVVAHVPDDATDLDKKLAALGAWSQA